MNLLKKSLLVGVSATPGIGLEAAVIDYSTQTVLKYSKRPMEFSANQTEISDLDIFKDTLQDLLDELEVPKGSEIALNLPSMFLKVSDYPASMESYELESVIEDELSQNFLFQDNEACYAMSILPSMSMQFNKVMYTAYPRSSIIEIVMYIKEMGYRISSIETSVNSVLNALMYTGRVNTENDINWLLILVDNKSVKIASMIGNSYVDIFEESIGIGDVLGDAENYATVVKAIEPILKNIPAKYLCVVSKTDIISAEALSNKITYSAPIVYQEANVFCKEPLINSSIEIDETTAKQISLDIIGAAISREFLPNSAAKLSFFNKTLGEIYLSEQPLSITINGHVIELNDQNLIKIFTVFAIIVVILTIITLVLILPNIQKQKAQIKIFDAKINEIKVFLEENKNISAEMFDEGIEIRTGVTRNKTIYSYYTIMGTEIPQKLWLTHLKLSDKVTIDGQADNIESIYSFFRNIKDYNPEANLKLQKLGLASSSSSLGVSEDFDTAAVLSSMDADFYEFRISNEEEIQQSDIESDKKENNSDGNENKKKSSKKKNDLPDLEPIKE